MSKKIVAMLMAVAMAFSLLPVTALAGNTSLLSITPPDEGKFATYEFYTSKTAENPCYTQIVKTGDTLNRPADPTLDGHYFTGWKTADGGEVPFGTVTVEKTSTIQCYAQWEENKNPIHVYFMAAEGSKEVVYTGVAQNGTVTIPTDYKDITWQTADGNTFTGTGVTNDMNVYPASASCWLTFDSQGGSAIASHYVRQGESFELSKVGKPTKAGYTFAGWSLTTDGQTVEQVTPNGDTKLYALWTPATADYTVIHWQENANDEGYSYIASEKESGTTGDKTNAAAKTYQGFTKQAIEQQTIKGDGSTIVNVFYKRNVYEVKFKLDKPTYTCGKEEHKHTHGIMGIGSCYDKNNNLKCGKEAHTHDKSCGKTSEIVISAKYGAYIGNQWPTIRGSSTWKTSQYGSTNQVNIETMPLNGATFYGPKTGEGSESARYYVEVLPGETGTVTQGGVTYKLHHTDTTPGTRYEVTDEDKYELTGFTYKGGTSNGDWYNNAKFYYTRNSYDVVYMSNGRKVNEKSYKYEQDIHDAGNYTSTNAPDGYKFGGWCSDPSGTTPYDFSGKTMPAQNITVYAKWVPITLTLTIQGVDGVGSGNVSYNQAINGADVYQQATAKLTEANKTVLYWVNCETNQKEDVNRQMTTDLTIRPVLKGDTYSVTYSGGATTSDPYAYWYGTTAKVKAYQGENTNKFLYWTAANQQYHPGDEISMTADVTLTPHFNGPNPEQTYSVTYHSNFGTDQTYTPKESIENNAQFIIKKYEETRLPSQNGYKFTGWNTKPDGTGEEFEANSTARMNGPDNNHLYAQWSQKAPTYTLTYNANGGHFASEATTTTKEEMIAATGDHDLNYTDEYTPTHAQTSEGKNVIFLGWSTEKQEKVFSKDDVADAERTASSIITKVNIQNPTTTVYAVWSLDENNNNIPDIFEATVTYKIENGYWSRSEDGENIDKNDKNVTITLYEKSGHIWKKIDAKLGDTIPTGHGCEKGYTAQGWYKDSETDTVNIEAATPVTGNVTYTFKYTNASIPTTYTVILHLENGAYTTVPDGYTTTSTSGVYQYTVTEPTTIIKPDTTTLSRSEYDFQGWSLSKTDSQTLIEENETFTALYVKQSGLTGNYDKIDLYAVWKKVDPPVDPVKWDVSRSKTATPLAKNSNGDWTTTVKLTLPTVNGNKEGTSETEVQPNQTIAISKGSKVEDTIGKKFTLVGIGDSALENGSFTLTVGGKEITGTVINGHTVNFGEQNSDGIYPYTVDYAATSNKFDWNINEDVYAGTEVTLSYKLKLTNPQTAAGTYGVTDLDGNGFVDGAETTKVVADDALYTNEKAALYIKENDQEKEIAVFPKPSVSYTIKSSSGSHSGGSRPSLNTKDHYGYIIGYPVDYYTGQPTTDQTKKPVRPEGKITRAEVATIYFRMLTDESRTKFWSQSNSYSDVKAGDWFNNAVSTLSNAGIIAGYEDGSFRPNGYITRAEFATIAARFFDVTYNGKDLFPDISGHWAKDYINQAANKGFVNGYEDGTFKPDRNITRAEAVTLVNRTLDRHPDKSHFTKDMLVWPDNMDQTKWYYADMQEATNSHTYQMKENSDKTKYENWTKTLPIRNWEALEKAWSNANSSQGNGNVV